MKHRYVIYLLGLLSILTSLAACRSDSSVTTVTPASSGSSAPTEATAAPIPTTISAQTSPSAITETAIPQQDAWAQARSALPAEVPIYKPTAIPRRFGAPELLEARTDHEFGTVYTIVYATQDENLAFILNMGKGTFGNFPPSELNEPISVLGVNGELSISTETHTLGAFWPDRGRNYQIKAFSKMMTKEELLQIIKSLVPVEPSTP